MSSEPVIWNPLCPSQSESSCRAAGSAGAPGPAHLPKLYLTDEDPDLDFNGAVPDPAVAEGAWTARRHEVKDADAWLGKGTPFDAAVSCDGDDIEVRDVLVHLVEEYARHVGHADLLRECIDGRTGQ